MSVQFINNLSSDGTDNSPHTHGPEEFGLTHTHGPGEHGHTHEHLEHAGSLCHPC